MPEISIDNIIVACEARGARRGDEVWTVAIACQFRKALDLAEARFGPSIGTGRHRTVFLDSNRNDGKWVVKVPTCDSGVNACHTELDTQGGLCARTQEHPMAQEVGLPVTRMEFVEHAGYSEYPDWTWSVDCGQVGHTSDGRLVAYDWEHD